MKSRHSRFPILFVSVMLFCVLFMIWYLPALNERLFTLQDVRQSIETSRGRERKQQYEYDQTVAAIPEIQAELDRVIPLEEEADRVVQALKDERKQLRQKKKDLEAQLEASGQQEVTDGE